MTRYLPSSIIRRKAAELRARLLLTLQQAAGHPGAFAVLMQHEYGVTDTVLVESLRTRTRRGDLDWYPRLQFASDTQMDGRDAKVVDRVIMLSDAYIHANEEATRLFCRAVQACLTRPCGPLRAFLRLLWNAAKALFRRRSDSNSAELPPGNLH